ncbi:MAG: GHMP kinase [Clostridia bacterium]|nr:GHMP kinase [Clostridia bacterium]
MEQLLRAAAWAPGTCGELVEGAIDDKTFLVTCPIDLGSTIEVSREGTGLAEGFPKTAKAIELAAGKLDLPVRELGFERESLLPPGKGMGSSTADIAAAVLAVCRLAGQELSPREIAELALAVEPSDGIMFPGLVLFDHREGKWFEELGEAPAINILIADPGGVVDTVTFNRDDYLAKMNRKKEPQVKEALRLVKEGLASGDLHKIGRGATESALANQELLPKPDLPQMLRWAEEVKALGVNVAHSGTVMGILLAEDGYHPEEVKPFLQKRRPDWTFYCTRLINGGLK